jgi:hypothetical protein
VGAARVLKFAPFVDTVMPQGEQGEVIATEELQPLEVQTDEVTSESTVEAAG